MRGGRYGSPTLREQRNEQPKSSGLFHRYDQMRRLQNLRSGLQGQESARSRPQLQACLRYGEWHLPQAQALASVDLLQSLRRAGVRHQLSDDSDAHTPGGWRSEEHTSELQSLMRISNAVYLMK